MSTIAHKKPPRAPIRIAYSIGILLLFTSIPAYGQSLFHYENILLNQNGTPITGASIYVCTGNVVPNFTLTPPCPLATIYSNLAGTQPITQPTTTSPVGNYSFFLANGTYTVAGSGTAFTFSDVLTIPAFPGVSTSANNTWTGANIFNVPGVYTNTQNNQANQFNSGGFPTGSVFGIGSGVTDAVSGFNLAPSSSTVNQSNGVSGYAQSNSTSTQNVALYGVAYQGVNLLSNGKGTWGINTITVDSAVTGGTHNGGSVNGYEADIGVNGTPNTVNGVVVYVNGTGTMPAASTAFGFGTSSGTARFGLGFYSTRGAVQPSGYGVLLDGVNTGASQSSQSLGFYSYNGSNVKQVASINEDSNGNLNLNPATSGKTVLGNFTQIGLTTFSTLGSASGCVRCMIFISDSSTISAEGQTCSSGATTAIAISNGTVWKCF